MSNSRFYFLGIFPDDSFHPIAIGSNKKLHMASFLTEYGTPGWSAYVVCPSCLFQLPNDGFFEFPDVFATDPESFHLRFYPSSHPPFILRFQVDAGPDVSLRPWAVAVRRADPTTFDDVLKHLRENFPVSARGFDFDFGPVAIDPAGPIADQCAELLRAKVTLEVVLAAGGAASARQRLNIIREIIDTEESYVSDLASMEKHFTEHLFAPNPSDISTWRRTFKFIAQIRAIHARFLQMIQTAGLFLEAAIGAAFRDYLVFFKGSAPHVATFSSTTAELKTAILENRALGRRIGAVCQEFFDGSTIESLLVLPVQRIPRYPLLLQRLLKETPKEHWDYRALAEAYVGLQKLNRDIDHQTKEHKSFNEMVALQRTFGNERPVVAHGRSLLHTVEDGRVGALYLFNDLVLFRMVVPRPDFKEFPLLGARVFHEGGCLVVIAERNQVRLAESPATHDFVAKFKEARQSYHSQQCSFGGTLRWRADDAPGPPPLHAPGMRAFRRDVYVFGGRTDDGRATNALWWLRDGHWRLLEPPESPAPRYGCSLDICEAQLVVFGGEDGRSVFGDLWAFDIPRMCWREVALPGAPPPRFGHASEALTTQLWLFGGRDGERYFGDFFCCDLFEQRWYRVQTRTAPEPRAWASAFWIRDGTTAHFALFGGSSAAAALGTLWVFDYDLGDWFVPAIDGDPLAPRVGHAAAVFDQFVYIIGGLVMGGVRTDAHRINLSRQPYKVEILPQIGGPPRLEFAGCVAVADFGLLIFGGRDGHRRLWRLPLVDEVEIEDDADRFARVGEDVPPVFSGQVPTVMAGVGAPLPPPLDLAPDPERLARVRRLRDGPRWRKNAVFSATKQPLNGATDGGMLLGDGEFALPYRRRANEVGSFEAGGLLCAGTAELGSRAYSTPIASLQGFTTQGEHFIVAAASDETMESHWPLLGDALAGGAIDQDEDLSDINVLADWAWDE